MHDITLFFVNNLTLIIQKHGLYAVFVLMTLESALIPIPSEITMPFAGFLAGKGIMDFWIVVLIGSFGNLIGSLMAFKLGEYKGEDWIRSAIKKWGKYLLIKENDFDRAKKWYFDYGPLVTFTSRLLPVVRTFISLPAGISKMNIISFSAFTFIGSFIWSALLTYLGYKLGQNWLAMEPYFRKFQFLIVAFFVIGAILYFYHHTKKKK